MIGRDAYWNLSVFGLCILCLRAELRVVLFRFGKVKGFKYMYLYMLVGFFFLIFFFWILFYLW